MPWSHTGQTKHLGGGRARCGVLRTKQGEESSYVSPVTSVGCQSPTEGERQESLKWGVRVWVGRGVYICKGMSCQSLGGVMRLATHGKYFDVGNRAQIVKDASAWRGSQLWVSEGQRYGGDLQQCRRSSVERVPIQRCPEVGSSQTLSPVKWELMRVVGRGQREKSEPQQWEWGRGTSSRGKLVTYRGIEQIKDIKVNGR